ncbi:MAG: hypothetical protein PVF92_12975, partial [Desulfobacterales bacterium]
NNGDTRTRKVGGYCQPFSFLNGYFFDELCSPRGLILNVLSVRLEINPLCGRAHQKNPSFINENVVYKISIIMYLMHLKVVDKRPAT